MTVIKSYVPLPDHNNLKLKVSSSLDVHLVTTALECPVNDTSGCRNTHWRKGIGFEDQRRCPFHDLSWTPGEKLAIVTKDVDG